MIRGFRRAVQGRAIHTGVMKLSCALFVLPAARAVGMREPSDLAARQVSQSRMIADEPSSLHRTPRLTTDSVTPDLLVLDNGDRFNGTFVRVVDGTVTFHDAVLGDIHVALSKISELHTSAKVSVIRKGQVVGSKTPASAIPSGFLAVADHHVVLTGDDHTTTVATITTDSARYIVDQTSLNKQLRGSPGLFAAWNGSVTAAGTFVRATQNSYSFDGGVALVRTVPTVTWLSPRNRTTLQLNGTTGKITQPAYIAMDGTPVDEQVTKSEIYHGGLERDQYFSDHLYYFGTAQFDHNFSQNLQLQQLYGAGLGWTAIKTPKQTLDFTINAQYVRQSFMQSEPDSANNLFGSTISANYVVQIVDGMTFTQYTAYLPAYNVGEAYSLTERNSLTLPAYKGLRLVVGTTDSYLNAVAPSDPPSKRNSFQFTFGLSYDIKSSY
jgi:hypothetical protein